MSGGFVGGAQDDSASAWERGGVASVAHATTHATTNAVASNGHMKPGGPCDHCGAVDSPQWSEVRRVSRCSATRAARGTDERIASDRRRRVGWRRLINVRMSLKTTLAGKSARCAVGGDNGKFSRARAVVF